MISFILVFGLGIVIAKVFIDKYKNEFTHNPSILHALYWYHFLFGIIYYSYMKIEGSDALSYMKRVSFQIRGDNWLDHYGIGTPFIEFIGYPLIHYLDFSFEAIMMLFAILGYLGFIYAYLFLIKLTQLRHRLWGIDFIILVLFLPNLHFWSVSFGKGSVIFLGISVFLYGITSRKWLTVVFGALIIYHVRIHILIIFCLSLFLGSVFSNSGISNFQKFLIIATISIILAPLSNTFLDYVGLSEFDADTFQNFTDKRGKGLAGADSGVDISNYDQSQKILTFLFRPLFFDAPGVLGLIVSFENLLLLILFFKVVTFKFFKFIFQANYFVKFSIIAFLGSTFVLAQVSGNTGLAIRQKSQIMILFFFVLLAYADWAYKNYGQKVIGD